MSRIRTPSAGTAALWLVAAAAAFAIALLSGTQPGYDTSWHLVWAHQILDGKAPSFNTWAAPTEHPLLVALAVPAAAVGDGTASSTAMIAMTLLGMFALLLAMRRLGRAVYGSGASGIVGWLLLAGSYGLMLQVMRGFLDVWFLLLVTIAAFRVAERKRADAGWLELLLSGLLRPEGWLLAGLALLAGWRSADRGSRLRSLAAVAAPPLIWFSIDAAVTGHPLLSLETAKNLEVTGFGSPLHIFLTALGGGLRGPATLIGLVGLAMAWKRLGPRRLALPLILIGSSLIMVIAIVTLGLTLLPRYLMLCNLGLSLFGGYALAGWSADPQRFRSWRNVGVIAMAAAAIGAVVLGAPAKLMDEVRIDRSTHSALEQVLGNARVKRAMACGPLTFPSLRLLPDARLVLGNGNPEVRGRAEQPVADRGVAITIAPTGDGRWGDRYGHPGISVPHDESIPPGFAIIYRSSKGPLVASARCGS